MPNEQARPFGLPVSCPQCDTQVELVNGTTNGLLSVAVVLCGPCHRVWEITVRIRPFAVPKRERREREAVAA